ncbi:hypothetical protein F2Q70_00038248 [Brassica cretica]|uniref:Anaphase-promoting complex subunit 4 WD40 domain-containing protein n=1 Tax=Brassica cretica TaxID=69181 RepID=A0A8S9K7G7_BRACR|nr:hypothetical protein F2Q70_00038248 [Brassica cretica]
MDLMEKKLELVELHKLEGHTDRVWNVSWNPVGTLPILASCSGDNTVRIWEQSSLSLTPGLARSMKTKSRVYHGMQLVHTLQHVVETSPCGFGKCWEEGMNMTVLPC